MSLRWVGMAALCAGLTAGLCGCNNARMVRWDGTTGVVAIPNNDDSWPDKNREHALALMKEKCPQGYKIVDEQEVVTGQVQHTMVNTDHSGNPTLAALHLDTMKTHTNETTSVEDKKEWRITFTSANAPPMAVMTPPPGPSPMVVTPRTVVPVGVVTPTTPGGLPASPIPVNQ